MDDKTVDSEFDSMMKQHMDGEIKRVLPFLGILLLVGSLLGVMIATFSWPDNAPWQIYAMVTETIVAFLTAQVIMWRSTPASSGTPSCGCTCIVWNVVVLYLLVSVQTGFPSWQHWLVAANLILDTTMVLRRWQSKKVTPLAKGASLVIATAFGLLHSFTLIYLTVTGAPA